MISKTSSGGSLPSVTNVFLPNAYPCLVSRISSERALRTLQRQSSTSNEVLVPSRLSHDQ